MSSFFFESQEEERIYQEIRTRQCRFPTINHGRETALPCPLYNFDATENDIISRTPRFI